MNEKQCEFKDFGAVLKKSALSRKVTQELILDRIGHIVEKKAKELIGHEQPEWKPLSPFTIEDRTKKGYAPNEPLLREGNLRDSIKSEKEHNPLPSVIVGYAGDKVADYARKQELGDGKVPPRPTLKTAVFREMAKIKSTLKSFGYIFKNVTKNELEIK